MQFEENLGLSFAIRVELGEKADVARVPVAKPGCSQKMDTFPPAGLVYPKMPLPTKTNLGSGGVCFDGC